jgi:hypothetical protein|tara:strand:+ start:1270 stop:1644 length:375 start_codon:yes stop_codon:yes gene_type:complete
MKKIFLILSVGFLMTSCATIFTGSSEMITINSNVDDATVKFDGMKMGKTPLNYKVKKSFKGIVTVEAEGYEEERFQLQKSFNAISLLNLLTGPFFLAGAIIDLATGSINKFDVKGVDVELKEEK